ncbi:hypothetical protein BGZ75_007723 [Mortierella antarctica]|nr:hypothetical protein BGZ75_007723 [Mortierella antarctica]
MIDKFNSSHTIREIQPGAFVMARDPVAWSLKIWTHSYDVLYKVQWMGYSDDEDSFIPHSQFDSDRLIHQYWKRINQMNPLVVAKKQRKLLRTQKEELQTFLANVNTRCYEEARASAKSALSRVASRADVTKKGRKTRSSYCEKDVQVIQSCQLILQLATYIMSMVGIAFFISALHTQVPTIRIFGRILVTAVILISLYYFYKNYSKTKTGMC